MSFPKFLPLDAHIRLFGSVDEDMFDAFKEQLDAARKDVPQDVPIALELTTTGGEAETARRIASDLRLVRDYEQRKLVFLGKSAVYSAGITIMGAFKPNERYLVKGTELLIHERRIQKDVHLSGAIRSNIPMLQDALADLESGARLERSGFEQLVEGTRLSVEELMKNVMERDWYLQAEEALQHGLIRAVL